MKNQGEIGLWEAIAEMERISAAEGEFSFAFYTHNRDDGSGGRRVLINTARLRKRTSSDKISNSDHKLFFTDLHTNAPRNCWQILVVEFNGKKTII